MSVEAKLNRNKVLILIADDDEVDRKMLKRSLSQLNAEIVELLDGSDVLQCLKEKKYDCLILDYLLPNCDGLKLVKDIRETGISTPIIVITGHGDEMLAVSFLKAGAQDYLPKDKVNEDTLCQAVINAIRLKKYWDEREYYKYFYEKAPVGFYTIDISSSKFIKANRFLVNFLNCNSLKELQQIDWVDLCEVEVHNKLLEVVKIQGYATNQEVRLSLPDGTFRWAIVTMSISNCGNYLEGTITDITVRKKLEKKLSEYKRQQLSTLRNLNNQIREKCQSYV